jgi:hypothetical protein
MTFAAKIRAGWAENARVDRVNLWGAEFDRCAAELEDYRLELPGGAIRALEDLFFEIGRTCRDGDELRRRGDG